MTSPGTMPRGGPATTQKVVHASSRRRATQMRHTAGRQRQCQGNSQPRSGREGVAGQLKPVQTHTKNMCNMFVARLRTLCRLPLPIVVALLPFSLRSKHPGRFL